jgi:hypothetical protein
LTTTISTQIFRHSSGASIERGPNPAVTQDHPPNAGPRFTARQGTTWDASRIWHDFDAPTAWDIVARAARLAGRGGKLLILDVLVPENGQNNPVKALFDLMMLVEVPGGRSHQISDVYKWIESTGMVMPKSHRLYFGILVEARAE